MFQKLRSLLKEKLDKIRKDDSGSAFIFVVIGVMFVSIVGATVLSVATNYVTTVIVDHYSTDNFYQTEGYLSEIRSGIEEIAGKANEKAYLEVVEHYTSPKMTSQMKTIYGKKYLTGIVRKLNHDALVPTETSAEIKDIESKPAADSTVTTDWEQLSMDLIKKMSTNPGTLGSTYGTNDLRYRFEYDKDEKELYLVIRGLIIKYTDETGYRSSVKTDIRIGVPDYAFEGNRTYEELKHYISISDDILRVDTDNHSSDAAVSGNVYSGTAKKMESPNDDEGSGIQIHPRTKAVFHSKRIISRGNLNIFSGADVKMSGLSGPASLGELWLKNIVVRKPSPAVGGAMTSNVNINDNAYILDDTSIEDDNATVNLGGNYYGYSYNRDNSDTTEGNASLRSDYSSAILINGRNTTLTSNGLTKLILAGRTFVQRNEKLADGTYQESVDDIMMGESLAVRSNQIAYLVPEEFILDGHNPLVGAEVGDDTDARNKVNIAALKSLAVGNEGKTMADFLKPGEEITANYNNSGQYVYLYLNFKSEVAANEYFSCYYNQEEGSSPNNSKPNKEYLDDRAQSYIATLDGSMKISPALYLIAGNIVHDYYSNTGAKQQSPNYFDGTNKPVKSLLDDGQSKMRNYLGLQMALLSSGSESVADVRGMLDDKSKDELVKNVVLNIIDTNGNPSEEDNKFEKDGASLPDRIDNVPEYGDWKIICQNDDYMIDPGIDKGIVLCAKNVTVSSNFEGLIIAGGKVSVTAAGSYKANPAVVGDILDIIKNHKDKDWWKYFRCLDDREKRPANVAECISYEEWERNSD
ncbi:MAG: hypothetical protein HFG35_04775 [Eubacterium sp.]|jgi:hypothetical protein|nr:hypothetical protein [Eubacterium sp.]